MRVSWAWGGRVFVVASLMLMFGVHTLSVADPRAPGPGIASVAPASFIGDFETGNFDQWTYCQNVTIGSVPCSEKNTAPLDALMAHATYAMAVETNVVRQGKFAARFEVRRGDQPKGMCCGDRAEVESGDATAADEGDDRWYQWSTMFGDGFPAGQGWSVVSQWHANQDGSPPLAINAGPVNVSADRWGIVLNTWNAPDDSGPVFTPWSAPVVPGVWNDIKLHVKWSVSDNVGFIEFWLNGAPQKFAAAPCPGQTRCMVRTLMPGGGGVYFKQGYYRDSAITATGVVYQDGFSVADSEAGLAPL